MTGEEEWLVQIMMIHMQFHQQTWGNKHGQNPPEKVDCWNSVRLQERRPSFPSKNIADHQWWNECENCWDSLLILPWSVWIPLPHRFRATLHQEWSDPSYRVFHRILGYGGKKTVPLCSMIIPSGKQPHNYGKLPCYEWEIHYISMAMFNSYVRLPEGTLHGIVWPYASKFSIYLASFKCLNMH